MSEHQDTPEEIMQELKQLRQRTAELEDELRLRRDIEEALRSSERRYRQLVEQSQGFMCIHTLDGHFLYVNPMSVQAIGYHHSDMIGQRLDTYLAPSVRSEFGAYLERIRQNRTDSGFLVVVTKSGEERIWSYRNARYDEAGQASYVIGQAQDVTGQVQAERALRHSQRHLEQRVKAQTEDVMRANEELRTALYEVDLAEVARRETEEQYRTLVNYASDAIVILLNERVAYANPACERMTGFAAEELTQPTQTFTAFVAPEERARVRRNYRMRLRGESVPAHYETVILTKSGDRLVVDVKPCLIPVRGDQGVMVIMRDITEQKQAQDALRESENRYRTLVEGSIQGISVRDQDGVQVFANAALAKIFGYDNAQELIGRSMWDRIAPHERPRLQDISSARFRGEYRPTRVIYEGLHKDGTPIWIENVVSMIQWEGKPAQLTTLVDITERKQAEEALQQSQKIEALGTLAGGVAHEYNNVLTAILGFTQLALTELPSEHPAREHLQHVMSSGRRAKELVQHILTFSRQNKTKRKPLLLAELVQESLVLARATLPTTIAIEQDDVDDVGWVDADPTQLHQVMMNLISNAEYAMRKTGGTLTVSLRTCDLEPGGTTAGHELSAGRYGHLQLRDTGHGMSPQTLERIFEPFFTTKRIGEGTGMGLAIVHGIVFHHGGLIRATSSVGSGTTVDIFLPCLASHPALLTTPTTHDEPKGTGRILFVDDEQLLADLGRQMLERLGYETESFTNSLDALEAFRAQPQAFDLVVTDQTMPHLTGEHLAAELRRIRSTIPIILCTGFSYAVDAEKAKALGIDAFLMKPIETHELAVTIQEVLLHYSSPD